MAEGHIYYNIDSTDHSDDPEPKPAFQPEIGRDCCRVKREEWYGGYRNDFLTEDLTEREKVVLICKICKGIMKRVFLALGNSSVHVVIREVHFQCKLRICLSGR